MKRFVLIILLVSSAPVADQLVAYSRPLGPGFRLPQVTQFEPTQSSESLRKSSDELAAAALERPAPEYPALARAARITGKVEVEVVIDPRGNVVDARSISGHPLLKDAAVASVRHWKFNAAKLSQATTNVIGTVTVIFDLEAEKREKTLLAHPDSEWTANTRICRDEIAKESPASKVFGLALANLSVSALDEKRVDESLSLFEQARRENKLPADSRPYFAKLLIEKHQYTLEHFSEKNQVSSSELADYLTEALQLLFQAYAAESEARPVDARKLIDVARLIIRVYGAMGRAEERIASMRIILSSSALPDSVRAAISYELAVALWKKTYDSTFEYTRKNNPIPPSIVPGIRESVDEGISYVRVAQTLAPRFADSWFYEKLLIIQNLLIEADPAKREVLSGRAMEAQDNFIGLKRHSSAPDGFMENDPRPYISGLPSLSLSPTPPPGPPPPPPPPPPRAPRSGNKS